MKLLVENIIATRRASRSWVIKEKKGLPSIVVLILEFSVLLRCIFVYFILPDKRF